ncbi:hypothetical protein [Massilia sp. DWR3-1-1]|uniref:hypothetical protein n=1 Tax=Massilia sp. DWR3-1-1 TaxID=2804559 RepID=UPI003CE6FD40
MNITEFCKRYSFVHYGTPTNSWDSFHSNGLILMQLWQAPGQRIRNSSGREKYLRVKCLDQKNYHEKQIEQRVGYNGRFKSIDALAAGKKGFALIASPPTEEHGAGKWSKYANFDRIYPITDVEREVNGDIFVILAEPLPSSELGHI